MLRFHDGRDALETACVGDTGAAKLVDHPELGVGAGHGSFWGHLRFSWQSRQKNFGTLLQRTPLPQYPRSRHASRRREAELAVRLSPTNGRHPLMRWPTRWSLAAPVLLGVLACTLCISTYHIFGNFWDEPEHIAAGLVLIDRGEYRYDNQHPPLARLAAAIGPYLGGARFPGA